MKEFERSQDAFLKMALDLELKPSLEESQLNRKTRYFQRTMFPKPVDVDKQGEKKKKKKRIVEDSDDDMPSEKPKTRQKKLRAPGKVIDVIDLAGDEGSSSSPRSIIDLTMMSSDEENTDPVVMEKREEPQPRTSPNYNHLRGRLPKWYHSRKLEREKLLKVYAERREIRIKLEQEAEEAEAKAEQQERRRFMDRWRHQKKRDELRKASDVVKNSEDQKRTKRRTKGVTGEYVGEKEKDENQNMKKRAKRTVVPMLTDPSTNPMSISLGMPEVVPWAPISRKPKENEKVPSTPMNSIPSSSNSFQFSPLSMMSNSESPMKAAAEEQIRRELEELEKLGELEDIVEDLEPLFLEENEEFLKIPDNEIQLIEGNDTISDSFLQYFNNDALPLAELEQYL